MVQKEKYAVSGMKSETYVSVELALAGASPDTDRAL